MKKIENDFYTRPLLSDITLFLFTFLLYFKSLFFDFSPADDQWLIVNSESLLSKWSSIPDAFRDCIQRFMYRPLLRISLITDYHIGGLSPFIYHFSNISFHAIAVWLLYKTLQKLTTPTHVAFWLAMIFAAHPILLNAVSWIPGRNDSLLFIFFCAALFHLIVYVSSLRRKNLILHSVFLTAAFFTKETSIVFPIIYLMTLLLVLNKPFQQTIKFIVIWSFIGASWLILRNLAVETNPLASIHNVPSFLSAMAYNSGKLIVPIEQSVYPIVTKTGIVIGSLIIAGLFAAYFYVPAVHKKKALTGLSALFLALLLPTWYGSGTTLGEQYEHRLYLSCFGLFLFLSQLKGIDSKKGQYALMLITLLFSIKTVARMDVYKTQEAYLNDAISGCPNNYFLHFQAGNLYAKSGRYEQALTHYNLSLKINPTKIQTFQNRANVYITMNRFDLAISDLSSALKLSGNKPELLYTRYQIYRETADTTNAVKDLHLLLQSLDATSQLLSEKDFAFYFNFQLKAINRLIQINPGNTALIIQKAKLFMDFNQKENALTFLKEALKTSPQDPNLLLYLKECQK